MRPQSSSAGLPLASEGDETGEEGEGEGAEEAQEVPLTAHEACSVTDDWTHRPSPLPPQPAQPSSGHSIRDNWPFSVFWGGERERIRAGGKGEKGEESFEVVLVFFRSFNPKQREKSSPQP